MSDLLLAILCEFGFFPDSIPDPKLAAKGVLGLLGMASLNISATFTHWLRAARGKCGLGENAVIVDFSSSSVGFQSSAAVAVSHFYSLQSDLRDAYTPCTRPSLKQPASKLVLVDLWEQCMLPSWFTSQKIVGIHW